MARCGGGRFQLTQFAAPCWLDAGRRGRATITRTMSKRQKWAERAVQAASDGDLTAARRCFLEAVKADKNNHVLRFHYGVVLEASGNPAGAAEQFTECLRIEPTAIDAARRLGRLVAGGLPADVELNTLGLKAALTHHDFVNRDQIAEAAIYYLARQEPLGSWLGLGRSNGWLDVARRLCLKKTDPLLKDDLFLLALRDNIVRMPDLERLLTAVRRVLLLELPRERFQDRTLARVLASLMQQCWTNEYVWSVSDEEREALASHRAAIEDLFRGDGAAGIEIAIAALYQPISELIGDNASVESLKAIRPQVIRDVVCEHVRRLNDERSRSDSIPRIGVISDPTSKKVAAQYSRYPYPRWTSLGYLLRPGEWRQVLARSLSDERLRFMDEPFEVLIAGCGTGRQAISQAHAYGPNARITAIDLSMPSLAYAARMAEYYCAPNIHFAQGDLNVISNSSEFKARFHVVECLGVLHHMADPFQAWQDLTQCLRDDGLMLIGLYSALARRELADLREDPGCPGPGCDDVQLRTYRNALLSHGDHNIRAKIEGIKDVYTTSGFRDLLLHECEHNLTIPQIARFLDQNDLDFRGFLGVGDFDLVREAFPGEEWPGSLSHWGQVEEENPDMFTSMYQLWCEKRRRDATI